MSKKTFLTLSLFLFLSTICFAQTSKLSLGITSDIQLEAPVIIHYAMQGNYKLSERNALQLNLGLVSKTNAGFIGVDYLYTLFQRNKIPSIFIGAGGAYEFETRSISDEIIFNGQVGAQFQLGRFIPFIGFKEKFYFEAESFDSGNVFIGVRYHL